MTILANLLIAVAQCLNAALSFLLIIIIANAVLSWVNPDPNNQIVRFISGISDPLLRPIQRRMPITGRIDLSPLILILVIYFLQFFLVQTMVDYGNQIRLRESYQLIGH